MACSSSHNHQHHDDQLVNAHSIIVDISNQIALFRDLLINVGQGLDSPELREKIRKLRRQIVEACKNIAQLLLSQTRRNETEGVQDENSHLVLLFDVLQLLLRELAKCHKLVNVIPMDMTSYYENRTGPSNLGNVISQILLCKQITPDFNREELCSIAKDSREIASIVEEIQGLIPKQEAYLERNAALGSDNFDWAKRRKHAFFYKNMNFLCCLKKPKYL